MKLKLIKEALLTNGYFKIAVLLALGLLLIFFGMRGDEAVSTSITDGETLEERVSTLLSSLEGVGECKVLITYEEKALGYGKDTEKLISGIAVVCDGGDSIVVKERVSSVLSSLFGIGKNRIRVEKRS